MSVDTLQVAILFGLGGLLFLFERYPATRRLSVPLHHRWLTNIGLALLGGWLTGWLYTLDPLTVARSFAGGLLGALELPPSVEVIVVFLLLDFWRYWEHRIFHEVPFFWRVHLVHHSDTSIDITTTHRHHPIEPVITTLLLLILVFAAGLSTLGIMVYTVVAGTIALISHANIRLPEAVDATLRQVVVTPAVHAIHHSSKQTQTDSNYGSTLTIWDRIFGTYQSPKATAIPHFGLEYFYRPADAMLIPVLLQPFRFHADIRSGHRHATEHLPPPTTAPVLSSAWRKALQFGTIGLILALVAAWPIVVNLAALWNSSEAFMLNWLVAPMFCYTLGWHLRDQLLAQQPKPGYGGLGLLLPGLAIWGLAEVLNINLARHLAFVVLLQGIAICAIGFKLWRRYLPAFLMLFLLIPLGDLQPVLRHLTVYWIHCFSFVTGLPFHSEGFMVWINEQRYIVVDACSGLSFFVLGLFMAYYFGVLLYRSLAKIIALAFIGACLGVLANAIRVSVIIWMDHVNGSQMPLSEHGPIAWMSLLFVMILLLSLIAKLEPEKRRSWHRYGTRADYPLHRLQYAAPALAGLSLLGAAYLPNTVSALGTAYTTTSPISRVMQTYPASDWLIQQQNNQKTLTLHLNQRVTVTMQEVHDSEEYHHLSSRPLKLGEGANWRHQRSQRIDHCFEHACASYSLATWIKREQQQDYFQHLFYAYFVDDFITGSTLHYRLAQAWNRVTGNQAPHGMIGFMVQGDEPTAEQLAPLYHQFRHGQAHANYTPNSLPLSSINASAPNVIEP